jgi:hypothetical protein
MVTFKKEVRIYVSTNNKLHSGFINKITVLHNLSMKFQNPVGYLYTANIYMVQIPGLLVYDTTFNYEFFSYVVNFGFDKNTPPFNKFCPQKVLLNM